jgi:hypothetical protein
MQLGVVGLLILLVLFAKTSQLFILLYKNANATEIAVLGVAGLALVVGVITKNMTDDLFTRHISLLFWSLVGMALGYGHRHLAVQRFAR